jgi:enamine deaminase RidA (YjgF/YER057c/UK114 family)
VVAKEILSHAAVPVGGGLFSQGIAVDFDSRNRLVVISGQVAFSADGEVVGRRDFGAQFSQVYANLAAMMQAVDGTLRDIVQLRTFLTRPDDLEAYFALRRELYATTYPDGDYPTNTLLIVNGLYDPDLLLEIEALAVV